MIALAKAEGRRVLVIVLTDGAASHPGSASHGPASIKALRRTELENALEALGADPAELLNLDLPDGRLAEEGATVLADRLHLASVGFGVKTIFSTASDDPHPDHQTVAAAARLLALRIGTRLWSYPVRAHVLRNFLERPDQLVRLDISSVRGRKLTAIEHHASQLGGLITDDPDGFYLNPNDISAHSAEHEIYRLENG